MKAQVKKKLVQNFEFDLKDVKIESDYEVIQSRNILLNQLYTLKRFSLDDPQSQIKYERLLRQISILKELNGNYVIKCHKILRSKFHVYLVYDHHSGKTLNDIIQMNQKIIRHHGKIDSQNAINLRENLIDLQMIQNIAKQLYQILSQIHSKNIVHMRFCPQNLILQKNGLFKLSNFSYVRYINNKFENDFTEFTEQDQFTDPHFKKTKNVGFHTDIYSYGVILEKMYKIWKLSQKFQPHKQLERLIENLLKQNPQQRASQKQILNFFIEAKKNSQISKKRSRDELITNRSHSKVQDGSKEQLSTCRSLNSITHKNLLARTTQSQLRTRGQVNERSSDLRNRQGRKDNSGSFKTSLSRNRKSYRISSPSPQPVKNHLLPQPVSQTNDFSDIKIKILMKRSQSMILLQFANTIANQVQCQNIYTFQLTYLLYKKSMNELVNLAKYLSKGSPKNIFNFSQSLRLKFIKSSDYFSLCKVINQQLEEQRTIMTSISSMIKKQYSSVIFNVQNPEFQKQLKFQALNNDLLIETIGKYLQSFVEDFLIIHKNLENSKKIFFYLNVLLEVYKCKSYENFTVKYFEKEQKGVKSSRNKNFQNKLMKNLYFQKLKEFTTQQLAQKLVQYFKSGKT